MSELPSQSERPFDRLRFMEAWLSGYNACQAGTPDDFDSIMDAVRRCWEESSMGRIEALDHVRCTDKMPCGPRCPRWAVGAA